MVSFIGPFSHLLLSFQNMNSTAGDICTYRIVKMQRNTYERPAHTMRMNMLMHTSTHTHTKRFQCKQIEQIKRCPDTNNEYLYKRKLNTKDDWTVIARWAPYSCLLRYHTVRLDNLRSNGDNVSTILKKRTKKKRKTKIEMGRQKRINKNKIVTEHEHWAAAKQSKGEPEWRRFVFCLFSISWMMFSFNL